MIFNRATALRIARNSRFRLGVWPGAPSSGAPGMQAQVLQQNVTGRVPGLDEERWGADQLNLELRSCTPSGIAL